MVAKNVINQYLDLKKEASELSESIYNIAKEIERLEAKILDIEEGETVKDKVRGGMGGWQSFTIEGIPVPEYKRSKTMLLRKKLHMSERKEMLEEKKVEIERVLCDVERVINAIPDSHIRRIVRMRVIQGMKWERIAMKMGGGNNSASVKMAYYRYFDKK